MENRPAINRQPSITLTSALERERAYLLDKITVMLERNIITAEKFALMKAQLYA